MSTSAIKQRALDAVDGDYIVAILRKLVGARSENPPGDERNMALALQEILGEMGLPLRLLEVKPNRPSAVALISGLGGGPSLVLNGHIDTVPIGDRSQWTVDPFGGETQGDRLYGRGATDMKGGLAAAIGAVRALRQTNLELRGNLIMQFAMGEECGEPGTLHLLKEGYRGDYGIVLEPTELQVATAARGLAWLRCVVRGRTAHSGVPQLGVNAISYAVKAIEALKRYEDYLATKRHPLVPSPTCTVTVIHGGIKENMVPDRCEFMMDRRVIPGETLADAMAEVEALFKELQQADSNFRYELSLLDSFAAAEIPVDAPLAELLRRNIREIGSIEPVPCGTRYGSDVRNLVNDAGMEAITFGPGNIEQAHSQDEWVSLDQVHQCSQILAASIIDLLGVAES